MLSEKFKVLSTRMLYHALAFVGARQDAGSKCLLQAVSPEGDKYCFTKSLFVNKSNWGTRLSTDVSNLIEAAPSF
jgi:hypothetical protein